MTTLGFCHKWQTVCNWVILAARWMMNGSTKKEDRPKLADGTYVFEATGLISLGAKVLMG